MLTFSEQINRSIDCKIQGGSNRKIDVVNSDCKERGGVEMGNFVEQATTICPNSMSLGHRALLTSAIPRQEI